MTLARNIILFTVTVSFVTFVAFFGRLPAFRRNTPIGLLHRLLVVSIPNALRNLDLKLTNGRITNGGSRLGHHLMYEKHLAVVIFFLGLVTACASLFLPSVWHVLRWHHKLVAFALLPQPYLFLYLSAKRNDQTYINTFNYAEQMRHYPYDRVLYYPGNTCTTCKFLKPARSKHCSICKTCVSRMDHHCVWVNNCLGRGNYRWFLALLLFTGILILFGAYLAYISLSPMAAKHYAKYERWYTYKPSPGSDPSRWTTHFETKAHNFLNYVSIYLDVGGFRASGVGLLALLTWPLPLGLLAYHIYLIWAGMTTNESAKWADWRDDMAEGEEPTTTWPLESRHILIRTPSGQPPRTLPSRIRAVAREDSFERVWSLDAVENVYDLGFWDNFREVILN
ncbi:palmitoyltransferase swf1 [Setomelanomma holmii]|uniref:Palmitoyltransferase n=1 Tax=Setomelanomma holmii TaxID=210430 RepID=A0A9P4LHA9_9PLEO|nr:palmitoyltransferase swf1 [Setomelanomma holmii]